MGSLRTRIKERRLALGMSQSELARLLGYSDRSAIAKIEAGVNDLTHTKIEAFADILQTTAAYLMGCTDAHREYDKDGEQAVTTGERMKKRRKEIGLSAETVADRLGVSPATIYRYENGDIDKVPGERLAPIAAILQTTPARLMGWSVPEISNILPLPENSDRNVIRLVGRDGSVVTKELTDAELSAYKTMVDHLPEADDL